MNDFKIGQKVIFKEDYTDVIKKGSIAKVTGFWNDGIEFKIINEQKQINGTCLYSRVKKLKNKDNNKIIISKGAADSIEWLKNKDISLQVFKNMITLNAKPDDVTDELKELFKLDKKDILKAIFEGYEVEKNNLKELPDIFKFKIETNYLIFHAYKIKNKVVVTWSHANELDSVDYEINTCLEYINNGDWILI